ncbi:hypothetical protein PVAP13_J683515 [Panicum virgatum]|nr:hypothetical protein PVAP13_J683515 [Panicum virgatum]
MHNNSSFIHFIGSCEVHIIARRFSQPRRKSRLSNGTSATIVVRSSTLIGHSERSNSTRFGSPRINKFSNCVQSFCFGSEDSRCNLNKDDVQWVAGPYPSKLNDLREEGSPFGTTTFSRPSQPSRISISRLFAIDKLVGFIIRSFWR